MGKKKGSGKSKAPKGRAGAKKKAQKGPSNGGFGGGPDFVRQMLGDDDDAESFKLFKGFAQSKQRDFTPQNPGVKLRHQAISFVSAGSNTPAESDLDRPQLSKEALFVAAEDSDVEEDEDDEPEEEYFDDTAIQTNIFADTDVKVSEQAVAHLNLQNATDRMQPTKSGVTSGTRSGSGDKDASKVSSSAPLTAPLFVVDTEGDPSLAKAGNLKQKGSAMREPSPAKSDSSGEVVFRGRGKPTAVTDPPQTQASNAPNFGSQQVVRSTGPNSTSNSQQSGQHQGFQSMPNPWSTNTQQQPTRSMGWASKMSKLDAEVDPNAKWAPAPAGSWWKKKKGKPRPELDAPPAETMAIDNAQPRVSKVKFVQPPTTDISRESKDANEMTVDETIESLQADWEAVRRRKRQARQTTLEADDDEVGSKSSKSSRRKKRGRKKDNRQLRQPIVSEDEDDDGEAAYDDYMANIAAQLDEGDVDINGNHAFASVNVSGPSLVVNGHEIGDDEVLDKSHMNEADTSSASSGIIGQDLSEVSFEDDDADDNDSNMNSSELEDDLEYTEQEQWEDEEDLRQRRVDAMTDEHLARLFAKQEELGIHGDDIVIEDGIYDEASDDMEGIGDLAEARAGLADMTNFSFSRRANKHGMSRPPNRRNDNFPDASALADSVDQYGQNGFDIMDFDRPSLRPKKKGRKGRLPPEIDALSDEELKENIAESWDHDREKKRLKKAEREDLRRQGLLGAAGKKGKADLSQKYKFGITRDQIYDELRSFMQNDGQTSLPFPPMDKHERKALHDIANAMNLKSKSAGMGNNRFPVIYKTRLSTYDAEMFDNTLKLSAKGLLDRDTKFSKKYAKKNAKKGRAGKQPSKLGGRGGTAAATVRHGEVVGAGAAEISKDSFGHKMMEKMGWSKGMGLGREGEGMLNHVEQVVRTGRAGLG